ncbi:hypothetical protein O6H91_10G057600 [Diphasiastrum complanatum]|uniref:Uncharacterized protein n=1 Tax=Diphasiastrum complanatum TaxID=34168 RepID=A0ACC2CH91_DIPCM|nr:hypothetical protein O6H91_10G057600 [Diphasiastrum complanatum]
MFCHHLNTEVIKLNVVMNHLKNMCFQVSLTYLRLVIIKILSFMISRVLKMILVPFPPKYDHYGDECEFFMNIFCHDCEEDSQLGGCSTQDESTWLSHFMNDSIF